MMQWPVHPSPMHPLPMSRGQPSLLPNSQVVFQLPARAETGGREQDKLEVTSLTQNNNLGLPVRYSPHLQPCRFLTLIQQSTERAVTPLHPPASRGMSSQALSTGLT